MPVLEYKLGSFDYRKGAKPPTLADVKKAAAKMGGVTVEQAREGDSLTLYVDAPKGHRWEQELHEFVDSSNLPWKPDYDDMLSRMSYGYEVCADAECEWCHPDEDEAK